MKYIFQLCILFTHTNLLTAFELAQPTLVNYSEQCGVAQNSNLLLSNNNLALSSTDQSSIKNGSFFMVSQDEIIEGENGMNGNNNGGNDKTAFLQSLDTFEHLNEATKERTLLLNTMIKDKLITPVNSWDDVSNNNEDTSSYSKGARSLDKPGLQQNFEKMAPGTWKVIYAPHMTTMAGLAGGTFDVQYILHANGEMESHARYDFPIVGKGYLSVSGTYGSVDERVSRVDFNKVWVKPLLEGSNDTPYQSLDDVPDGPFKGIINAIGGTVFLESVSVFPVSFLDDDMIVFDFELLGTRICGKKIA